MENEGQYRYQRIDLATDAIRIVRLLKGHQEDPIRCELFQALLHQVDGLPYEALSYCWGDSLRAYQVFVNEREKYVKQNLYMALLALRQPHQDRLLWIDAICIDQDNHKEKGHQVGQMRQIYENAEQVLIWLGPSSYGIDSLLDFVRRWDFETRQRPEAHIAKGWIDSWIKLTADETGPYKEALTAGPRHSLQEMLNRPWFRRVWILQEVASAKRATILCGSNAISSRGFSLLPFLLEVELDSHTEAVLDILPGYRRKETWWGERQDLETLLLKFGTSEATDDRDKIYALLGIASDACASSTLLPDYTVSLELAICHTISFLLFHEAYDPSARPLPEDMDFATFLHILPQLSYYILGWALQQPDDVTAAAIVPKVGDINILFITAQSPLSWIISSSASFHRTLCAMMERDDLDVLLGDQALMQSVKQDRPEIFKLLVQHPSAASSGLTMSDAETFLEYAAASADRASFGRIVSILTSPNPASVMLESAINRAIHEQRSYVHTQIDKWLFDYLKSLQGRIAIESLDADTDTLFETLATLHNQYHHAPRNYLAVVLLIWKHKVKGDSLSFERIEPIALDEHEQRPLPSTPIVVRVLINGKEPPEPEEISPCSDSPPSDFVDLPDEVTWC